MNATPSEPLTSEETLALESAAELAPAKLNEAVDKKLTFVTSNLALIATIATGFGLFADGGGQLRQEGQLRVALGLLLLAVVISLIGAMPNWFRTVNVDDPASIQTYFYKRRAWRAGAARVAIFLFVIAAGLTALAVYNVASRDADPKPKVSIVASSDKDGLVTATASLEGAGLDAGSEVRAVLTGCQVSQKSDRECPSAATVDLASGAMEADSAGGAALELTAGVPSNVRWLRLEILGAIADQLTTAVPDRS